MPSKSNASNARQRTGRPPTRSRPTRQRHSHLYERDPISEGKELDKQLKIMGLYDAKTTGDGNCMFRALSTSVYGDESHHCAIRSSVCDFLEEHQDQFFFFVDDTGYSSPQQAFQSHVDSMRIPATYGGQLELVAFSRLFGRKIRVIQPGLVYVISELDESPAAVKARESLQNGTDREKRVSRRASRDKLEGPKEDVYLIYFSWEHYSSPRNLVGPHTGLPQIRPLTQDPYKNPPNPIAEHSEDDNEPSEESKLVLTSLQHPERYTHAKIHKMIRDLGGTWERVAEVLIDKENSEYEHRSDVSEVSSTVSNPGKRSPKSSPKPNARPHSPSPPPPSSEVSRHDTPAVSSGLSEVSSDEDVKEPVKKALKRPTTKRQTTNSALSSIPAISARQKRAVARQAALQKKATARTTRSKTKALMESKFKAGSDDSLGQGFKELHV